MSPPPPLLPSLPPPQDDDEAGDECEGTRVGDGVVGGCKLAKFRQESLNERSKKRNVYLSYLREC